jgi:hypothetical protein
MLAASYFIANAPLLTRTLVFQLAKEKAAAAARLLLCGLPL